MKLFGSSGIRKIADYHLLELAVRVGMVVGQDYASVVVGRDTRTSGDAIKHAFISGLLAAGCRGYDAGIVPTPTLALAARDFDAGAVITASHNPPEYNGIKLWNRDGSAFDAEQRKRVEDRILGNTPLPMSWQAVKSSNTIDDAVEKHTDHILKDVSGVYDIRVVVDCGCGAASLITPYLLRRLGCDVVTLNCFPSVVRKTSPLAIRRISFSPGRISRALLTIDNHGSCCRKI